MAFGNLNPCNNGATQGGVLSQIIGLGAADVHLTADPDVTFWRLRIQKCTNFAMESITQTFTGNVAFGSTATVKLNRTGDLVYWLYVVVTLPGLEVIQGKSGEACSFQFPCCDPCNPCGDGPAPVCAGGGNNNTLGSCDTQCGVPFGGSSGYGGDDSFVNDDDEEFDDDDDDLTVDACTGLKRPYAHWVNEVGFAVIRSASFAIGGQVIDTVYSQYLHMWEELSGKPGKRLTEMIGKRDSIAQLVADSKHVRRLYVPLPFYFTQFSGNALPLISLQFHSVDINICFAPLSRLIQVSDCDVTVVNCVTGQKISNNDLDATVDATYVYLDVEERDRFATGSFQQLITQVQPYTTTTNNSSIQAQLNFNHPTIELIWAVQRKCQAEANNTFNFSGKWGRDPITRACLTLNNLSRFDREASYFRLVQPYEKHTNIPKGFIYCYSFALLPESCHPSGSLNMSRIDNVNLNLSLQQDLGEVALYVFARSWNILRFKQGLGGILYSN